MNVIEMLVKRLSFVFSVSWVALSTVRSAKQPTNSRFVNEKPQSFSIQFSMILVLASATSALYEPSSPSSTSFIGKSNHIVNEFRRLFLQLARLLLSELETNRKKKTKMLFSIYKIFGHQLSRKASYRYLNAYERDRQ